MLFNVVNEKGLKALRITILRPSGVSRRAHAHSHRQCTPYSFGVKALALTLFSTLSFKVTVYCSAARALRPRVKAPAKRGTLI
jgi:hypothetical protein